MPHFAALIGLGFGDCGKGLFTDALCRHWPVHTVVRYNGGAQAGHNVVLPDGRHHTFSQFCSGSFVPGVVTLLASEVIVHPSALWVEEERLRQVGVHDAWSRLMIDARCRVTTPYHQAAGRLREWQRGVRAHGSCGVGVGETVQHALHHPEHTLRYADLLRPALAARKLAGIRRSLAAEFEAVAASSQAAAVEAGVLVDEGIGLRWLELVHGLARRVAPADPEAVAQRLQRAGTVLFEGAQGMLLDEWHGFHPHTTWSSTGPAAAETVLAQAGIAGQVLRLGIARCYLTRHGAGPLPTHDAALDALAEPHNGSDGWQGPFRRGHADAVLLRYALDTSGPLDGLLLSHLDVLQRDVPLRWCSAYRAEPAAGDTALCERDPGIAERVTGLKPGVRGDLGHQAALTRLLQRAQPEYEPQPCTSPVDLMQRFESVSRCRVHLASFGPTHRDVQALHSLGDGER